MNPDLHKTSLDELIRLEDPGFYLDDPFPAYRRLRREAPMFRYRPLNTWVVSRYEDVRYVTKHADLFSSAHGQHLTDAKQSLAAPPPEPDAALACPVDHGGAAVGGAVDGEGDSNIGALLGDGELISVTDPPRHGELRRLGGAPFLPGPMRALRPVIERHCDTLLDQIVPGETVDWSRTVATRLPMMTVASLLGLADDDTAEITRWVDAVEAASNPQSEREMQDAMASFASLGIYVRDQLDLKRRCRADDGLSLLVEAERTRPEISEANIVTMAQALIAGGNGTTWATLAGFVALLAEYPEQRERVVADPALIPQAIEEVLRWVTPARGFLRTVTREVRLHDQVLAPGDKVFFLLESANRDEEAFDEPDVFDVGRASRRPALSFGHGPHVCIAAPLARMEVRVLAERLVARLPRWEYAGRPRRLWSIFRSSWDELPIRFASS